MQTNYLELVAKLEKRAEIREYLREAGKRQEGPDRLAQDLRAAALAIKELYERTTKQTT